MGPKKGMSKTRASTNKGQTSSSVPSTAQIIATQKLMEEVTPDSILQEANIGYQSSYEY